MIAWPQILLTLYATAGAIVLTGYQQLRLGLLLLAGALRFPFGAPLYVWRFVLGFSARVPGNYFPYGLTVLFWLLALTFWVRHWKKSRAKNVKDSQMPELHGSC